ncbi:MAG: AmmeMemoRadiSam system protein B [Prolixibacteraceae bacterium]|nr:AmmeMemoRadiSam system protein B [Prolixibacteraceae bacterium]
MNDHIRRAQFAGKFYPDSTSGLEQMLQFITKVETPKMNLHLATHHIHGGIVPHAGFQYSGYHAIHFYELLKRSPLSFETFIIINPNHSGRGSGLYNSSSAHYWETPLGKAEQDLEFLEAMNLQPNDAAHELEHSGEVQLPMLQHFIKHPFRIVMITMNHQHPDTARELARIIYQAKQKTGRKIVLIASSDFSHYEKAEKGFAKDQHLIDQILKLASDECFHQVKKHHISACGYGPIMTLIEYLKLVTVKPTIELLRRGHSGEVSHSEHVVDYISFVAYDIQKDPEIQPNV